MACCLRSTRGNIRRNGGWPAAKERCARPAPGLPIRLKDYTARGVAGRIYDDGMAPPLNLPGFPSPPAGPEAPLDMLMACHERVERQCRTLERLQAHLAALAHQAGAGADRAVGEAATAVLRYFDTAAVHHHADEEQDLFPALLEAMAGSDAVCIQALTTGLAAEHRALERHWAALRPTLQALAAGQDARLMADAVAGFVGTYRAHIEREETELIPMARRLLGEAALARMGEAMRARRGI